MRDVPPEDGEARRGFRVGGSAGAGSRRRRRPDARALLVEQRLEGLARRPSGRGLDALPSADTRAAADGVA